MKSLLKFTLPLLLIACGEPAFDDNSTNEALAKTLFSSIKNNDVVLFSKYMEQQEQINWRSSNWESFRTDYAERALKRINGDYKKLLDEVRLNFKEAGFSNWESASYETLQFKSADNSGHPMSRYNQIYFTTDDGSRGIIDLTLMYQTDKGWYSSSIPKYKGFFGDWRK